MEVAAGFPCSGGNRGRDSSWRQRTGEEKRDKKLRGSGACWSRSLAGRAERLRPMARHGAAVRGFQDVPGRPPRTLRLVSETA